MGYLNNDSITVDAILTKHGRYKLSETMEYYAISDNRLSIYLKNHLSLQKVI